MTVSVEEYQRLLVELLEARSSRMVLLDEESERVSLLTDIWHQLSLTQQNEIEQWLQTTPVMGDASMTGA